MTIRYPNGKLYTPNPTVQNEAKKDDNKEISFSNRGKTLEDEINEANDYYIKNDLLSFIRNLFPYKSSK